MFCRFVMMRIAAGSGLGIFLTGKSEGEVQEAEAEVHRVTIRTNGATGIRISFIMSAVLLLIERLTVAKGHQKSLYLTPPLMVGNYALTHC